MPAPFLNKAKIQNEGAEERFERRNPHRSNNGREMQNRPESKREDGESTKQERQIVIPEIVENHPQQSPLDEKPTHPAEPDNKGEEFAAAKAQRNQCVAQETKSQRVESAAASDSRPHESLSAKLSAFVKTHQSKPQKGAFVIQFAPDAASFTQQKKGSSEPQEKTKQQASQQQKKKKQQKKGGNEGKTNLTLPIFLLPPSHWRWHTLLFVPID